MATDISTADSVSDVPDRWRWSRDDFHRLDELGFFAGRNVELLDGVIVPMNPQGPRHVRSTHRVVKALERAVGEAYWVRMQAPLAISEHDEPEPDAAIVPGTDDDYDEHPTTALLVVEVSETTRRFDRSEKSRLYAAAGIPEYWVVDLITNELVVYRDPSPTGYRSKEMHTPTDVVTLSQIPSASLLASELFPHRRRGGMS